MNVTITILSALVGVCATMVTPTDWQVHRRLAASLLMGITVTLLAIIALNVKDLAQ